METKHNNIFITDKDIEEAIKKKLITLLEKDNLDNSEVDLLKSLIIAYIGLKEE